MSTINDRSADGRIYNLFLVAILGPSFLVGGLNILLITILGFLVIWSILREGHNGISGAAFLFTIICLSYYTYFAWNAHAHAVDERASRFFVENIAFIFVALLSLKMEKLSVSKILKISSDVLFPAILILLIITLIERHVYGVARVEALGRSPLILAALIVGGVHISLADWQNRSRLWCVGAAASWLIGLYIILFLTDSRASFALHFICGGVFLCNMFLNAEHGWKRNLLRFFNLILLVLFFCVVLIVVLYYADAMPRIGNNIAYLTGSAEKMDNSSFWRVEMWRYGMAQVYEAPLLGYGPQNTFMAIKEIWPYDHDLGHLHSDFLNHLVGGGIIGLLLYFAISLAPIAFIFINKNHENLPIYICVLTSTFIVFGGLTARVFLRPVPMVNAVMMIFFALAVSCHYANKKIND